MNKVESHFGWLGVPFKSPFKDKDGNIRNKDGSLCEVTGCEAGEASGARGLFNWSIKRRVGAHEGKGNHRFLIESGFGMLLIAVLAGGGFKAFEALT